MAPAITSWLTKRSIVKAVNTASGPLSAATHQLLARNDDDDKDKDDAWKDETPSAGVMDPHDINNIGFFVLFALIGVAFVVTGIWFFFWAKNGGFYFQEDDWDDYKSTVLRRKGPNGTILSNATKTTKLGGGSVYKDIDDDTTTVVTESTGLSGITAGPSDIDAREKRREKREQREREKQRERRKQRGSSRRHVGEEGVEDDYAEKMAQKELRSYRHEKAARVGGLNKESEGSTWDGSTNPSEAATSELLSNRQETPTHTPTGTPKKPSSAATGHGNGNNGIRKVYSTADRNNARESERIRAEARRLREEGRTARRDFSYQRSQGGSELSGVSESLLEGSDLGTKSYHHPIPELTAAREQRQREREERRARRGGYRRGRGEDHDD